MSSPELKLAFTTLPAPLPIRRGVTDAEDWLAAALSVAENGGRLVSLWGADRGAAGFAICAAYALAEGLVWLELPLADAQNRYPDLAGIFPYANRMQRATADLLGIRAEGAEDERPWFNHGAWPADHHPLRGDASGAADFAEREVADYPFLRVEGDGVHEIPVGPVHAG
ncbi:MAG TPA: NADH-quinone oxidoreductase subunit C, partial [Steroidobacteraceae bacterium]|nr:NADH-quinone oxidoreductase subunit C [Steroidobacteraceae bacterium]